MAYVWKHPKSPFWMAVYRDEKNQWRKKTTKKISKTTARALADDWERAARMGRDNILTEAISREVIGDILKRTSGETLRQSTVREFCAEWMRGKTNSRQAGTATRYEASVKRFNELLGVKADRPISAVTPHDCQKFYDELAETKLAPATMRVEMKTIVSMFNYARRLGLITTNPAAAVQLWAASKTTNLASPHRIRPNAPPSGAAWRIFCAGTWSCLEAGCVKSAPFISRGSSRAPNDP